MPARPTDDLREVKDSIEAEAKLGRVSWRALGHPSLRLVMTIGISVGILQQITGINSVFFYAPMIFEQSGIGTNAAFMQAVLVGLVNVVFTVVAMSLIDRVGRRPLLGFGLSGIAVMHAAARLRIRVGNLHARPGSDRRGCRQRSTANSSPP